jgi:hypothetical protein
MLTGMLHAPRRQGFGRSNGRNGAHRHQQQIISHSSMRCIARLNFDLHDFLTTSNSRSETLHGNMAVVAVRTMTNSLRTFFQTRTKYHHTANDETMELRILTARSNADSDLVTFDPSSTPSLDKAAFERVSTLASIQRYKQRLSGWRFGVLSFAIMACLVFVINLVVTVWGSVAPKAAGGVLDQGDCGRIKTLNSGLHILINVLSTILLSGSNYCMQCMSAPTRGEIDQSHVARTWLDVGIPSFRNLKRIDRRRLLLWLLLGTSSLPLHLLYVLGRTIF